MHVLGAAQGCSAMQGQRWDAPFPVHHDVMLTCPAPRSCLHAAAAGVASDALFL